ncbi:MAG: prepilin-type N-terminal cleavage/methylation domain-containing protein [Candidatus Wolfebacteria bacterium]|nr:prepilin-type N-terminal cleavage/methylation domain-containing protein [Candidatus Wolfebacteria bacterium]
MKGFTLVEMLIVVAITAMLSSLLIVYNRTGEYQIVLFREQSKLASAVFRAKTLSVATFGKSESPCGYGVHLDPGGSYFIYRVFPLAGEDCFSPSMSKKYVDGASDKFESDFFLPSTISFVDLDVSDIFFMPPNPDTYIFNASGGDARIVLAITQTGNSSAVVVTPAGQITAQ